MKKNTKKPLTERRRTVWERFFFYAWSAILIVWSAIMLFMLFWAFVSAFKTNLDYVREPLKMPELANLQWQNFLVAMKKMRYNGTDFLGMFWNSAWQVLGGTIFSVGSMCLVGYIFGQYDFKGKEFLLSLIIFTMIIPIFGNLPAMYKLIYDLNLNDSPRILIINLGGFGASTLVTYGFYKGIPRSYREAVYIDGGSDLASFIHIGMPMSKSIFTAYFLLNFIASWNDFQSAMLYFDKLPNLALGLYYFQQEIVYEANNPAYFAGALIVMLPVLIVFILFSDKIMGKLYSGGLKG